MTKPSLKDQRLVALFLFGCMLLNYPLLSLFDSDTRLWGVPILFGYVFAVWALLIAVIALVVETPSE